MLKVLLKKQLRELGGAFYINKKDGKKRSAAAIILYCVLMLYVVGAFGALFFITATSLCAPLCVEGLGWLYFALMGTIATLLGVVGSIFTTYSGLYQAKDNELLLSMPIPPGKILLVRMLVIYMSAFAFEAVAMIPTAIVYFMELTLTMEQAASAVSIINIILIIFILPLVALTLSSILGWVVALVVSKIRSKNFIIVALSLGFIAVYYYVFMQAQNYLTQIITNSGAIGDKIKIYLYPLYKMGEAAEGSIISMLIFAAIAVVLFGAVYAVLSKSFIKLATAKRGEVKRVYREKSMKSGTKSQALLRKEIKRFFGSATYMLNCGLGSVMLIVIAVLVVVKAELIEEMLSGVLAGMEAFVPALVCVVLAFLAAMNTITAPSVSLEGKNIWLVQSMPVTSWQVLKAKLSLQLLITGVPAVLAMAALIVVLKMGIEAFIVVLFMFVFMLFCAALGLAANLWFPNLEWTNETVPVKQGGAVLVAMFGSWIMIIALAGGFFALMTIVTPMLYIVISTVVVTALTALLLWYLKTKGTKRFEEL